MCSGDCSDQHFVERCFKIVMVMAGTRQLAEREALKLSHLLPAAQAQIQIEPRGGGMERLRHNI